MMISLTYMLLVAVAVAVPLRRARLHRDRRTSFCLNVRSVFFMLLHGRATAAACTPRRLSPALTTTRSPSVSSSSPFAALIALALLISHVVAASAAALKEHRERARGCEAGALGCNPRGDGAGKAPPPQPETTGAVTDRSDRFTTSPQYMAFDDAGAFAGRLAACSTGSAARYAARSGRSLRTTTAACGSRNWSTFGSRPRASRTRRPRESRRRRRSRRPTRATWATAGLRWTTLSNESTPRATMRRRTSRRSRSSRGGCTRGRGSLRSTSGSASDRWCAPATTLRTIRTTHPAVSSSRIRMGGAAAAASRRRAHTVQKLDDWATTASVLYGMIIKLDAYEAEDGVPRRQGDGALPAAAELRHAGGPGTQVDRGRGHDFRGGVEKANMSTTVDPATATRLLGRDRRGGDDLPDLVRHGEPRRPAAGTLAVPTRGGASSRR